MNPEDEVIVPRAREHFPGGPVRSAARVVGSVVAALLLLCGAVWAFRLETFFLYHPERGHRDTPDRLGLGYRALTFRAADGVGLHGWLLPDGGARLALARFNGNGGTMADRLSWVQLLRRGLGIPATVLLFDYRGYGQSEGRPSEEGLHRDGAAAVAALRGEAPGLPVVCVGESLGTGVAVELAAAGRCDSLVLEAPFASIPALANEVLPPLPFGLFVRTSFNSLEQIPRVRVPIYMAHAEGDAVIPIAHAERLRAAATAPVRLIRLPRGGHSSAIFESAELYVPSLAAFLWESHHLNEKPVPKSGYPFHASNPSGRGRRTRCPKIPLSPAGEGGGEGAETRTVPATRHPATVTAGKPHPFPLPSRERERNGLNLRQGGSPILKSNGECRISNGECRTPETLFFTVRHSPFDIQHSTFTR